ncbi:hypothetical protein RHMOL_Rhmol12G0194700 [Rhododendron molle]|nr:hypothetical protein RHMOL_Rhmol12G0194700 [Rhododendron molle]
MRRLMYPSSRRGIKAAYKSFTDMKFLLIIIEVFRIMGFLRHCIMNFAKPMNEYLRSTDTNTLTQFGNIYVSIFTKSARHDLVVIKSEIREVCEIHRESGGI